MESTMADLFQDKAEDWDARDVPRQLSAGIGACLLAHVELHQGMHVMDFGAGTGLIAAQVADQVGRVTAVDVSIAMLDKLAAKPQLRGKVDIVCQDILEQPLGKRFDLIVSAMAMHHVEDTDRLVQRFAEHLEPGGKVALADLDAEDGSFHPPQTQGVHHSGFTREAFEQILEAHGFRDIQFHTATTVDKEGRRYPVFLAIATKV
jgi:2-polyprenyl-3-methyl-5-hydroxy-6-metoxy-1,4-benzoquinol methylase